jgi:hypothetical protein
MTLAIPLETMRGIRRETKDLSVEACAKDAHEGLIEHMDAAIDAYNAFMAQEDESLVTFRFQKANSLLDAWVLLVADIGE